MPITVKEGNIVYDFDTRNYLRKCKDGVFIMKKYCRNVTYSQHKYLRGGIYKVIEDYTGQERDIIHQEMAFAFLKDETGTFHRIKSTAELSTIEMTKFIEQIVGFRIDWAGLVFLSPEEWKKNPNLYE